MKEMVRYGFILAFICTVAAGLLAGVNLLTRPIIMAQAKAEEEASLDEVMLKDLDFQPVEKGDKILYYKAFDKKGKFVGVVFKTFGNGYAGTIETMVGMSKEGVIQAIKILAQNETPGLGSRVTESGFTQQFANKNIRGLNEVQAITGATISSTAVMESVKIKAREIEKLIENVPKNE